MTRPSLLMRASAIYLAMIGAAAAADPALVAAAQKEGEIDWYCSLVVNQAARPLADAFEHEYPGIKVRITAGTVGDLLVKILNEGQAGAIHADVSHGGSEVQPLVNAGLIQPYASPEAVRYPAAYKDPNNYWTAEVISFLVPAINTDLVKPDQEPHTWQDLLDPKWQGKIAWTTQMTQGGPPGFIGTILQTMGPAAGMDYLHKLAAQRIVNVPANQRVVLDQVISGQYPMALATFSHHSELSIKKGAPVKWLKLDPATGTSDPIFLIKNSPHPNAGKLFIDFILSEKGQEALRAADYIPADPAVPAAIPGLKPETGHFNALFLSMQQVDAQMSQWVAIYNELFR